jgi:hypothetical protein
MDKLHYTTLKKGTLLFRLVSNPSHDLQGPVVENGKHCITENYNVFFYPNPFVGKIILVGKTLSNIDKIHIYKLKYDVKVLNLLAPSRMTRGHKVDKRQKTLRKCSTTRRGCLPFKGREFDPCFTVSFMRDHPTVLGMVSIAHNDSRGFEKRKGQLTDRMTKYIHLKKDSQGTMGMPEIMLYPLKTRSVENITSEPGEKLDTIYEVVDVLPIKEDTLVRFMEDHTTYEPRTSFYLYKEKSK